MSKLQGFFPLLGLFWREWKILFMYEYNKKHTLRSLRFKTVFPFLLGATDS